MRFTMTILAASALAANGAARADVAAAQRYVAAAVASLDANDFGDAGAQLELAEAELERADAAKRSSVDASIAAARGRIAAREREAVLARRGRELADAVAAAGAAVGDLVTWDGASAGLRAMLDDPSLAILFPSEVADARRQLDAFSRDNAPKAAAARAARADALVAALETRWANERSTLFLADDPRAATDAFAGALMAARHAIAAAPADAAAPLTTRLDAVGADFANFAMAFETRERDGALRDAWEETKWSWSGWRDEKDGVTFEEIRHGRESALEQLNAEQTVTLVARADAFLASIDGDVGYHAVASDPAIKAIVDPIRADRDAARAKLEGIASAALDEAEAARPFDEPTRAALRRFADALPGPLAGSPKLDALAARARAIADGDPAATTRAAQ